MSRSTVARDLMAISGGILAVWSLLLFLYTLYLRIPFGDCVAGQWLVAGYCINAWKWLLIPFLVGIALVVVGLVVFRFRPEVPEDLLRTGGGIRMLMGILASLAVFPMLGAVVVAAQGASGDVTYTLRLGTLLFGQAWFFGMVGLVGLVLFVLGFGVHLSHELRRLHYLDSTEPIQDGWVAEAPAEDDWHDAHAEPGVLPAAGYAWQGGDGEEAE